MIDLNRLYIVTLYLICSLCRISSYVSFQSHHLQFHLFHLFTSKQRLKYMKLAAYGVVKRHQSTYVPIALDDPKLQTKVTYLVTKEDMSVLDTLIAWEKKTKDIDPTQLSNWIKNGIIFESNSKGLELLEKIENIQSQNRKTTTRLPWYNRIHANLYVNVGKDESDLKLVKVSVGSTVIEQVKQGTTSFDILTQRGQAFDNVTKLWIDESITSKGNQIALTLKNDYHMSSGEWSRWVNKTATYNASSLGQVIATYFREHSVGDLGGDGKGYIPRANYPGTLAPGDGFNESDPFNTLPNYVLHPWPAVQEHQFHVRWPPSHPIIFPPLLMFALNDMYTQNFTEQQISAEYDKSPVVGGPMMEAKDALRIARFAKFGMAYKPEEQIEHGGMLFPGGHKIPFYNPDHGPTVSAEEAMPSIPKYLKPIVESWYDPEEDNIDPLTAVVEGGLDEDSTTEEDRDAMEEENELRRLAAERLGLNLITPKTLSDEEKRLSEEQFNEKITALRKEKEGKPVDPLIIPPRTVKTALNVRSQVNQYLNEDENARNIRLEKATKDNEKFLEIQRLSDEEQVRKEVRQENYLASTIKGKVRSQRQLISYAVELMTEMQEEMIKVERGVSIKPTGGRRRQRKRAPTVLETKKVAAFTSDPFDPNVVIEDPESE